MIYFFKETYSEYILERLKDGLIASVNYKITEDEESSNIW